MFSSEKSIFKGLSGYSRTTISSKVTREPALFVPHGTRFHHKLYIAGLVRSANYDNREKLHFHKTVLDPSHYSASRCLLVR